MKRYVLLTVVFIVLFFSAGYSFDHTYSDYALFLDTYVKDGLVDYKNLSQGSDSFDKSITQFTSLTKLEYDTFSRNEKISYLINAYNLFTIKAIIDNYPVASIKDIRGVWNKLKFTIAGQRLTLDNVEHDMLRKEFQEERIHVAVVCASISCPELWDNPYLPDSLDHQLTKRSAAFANDTLRNEINFDKNYFRVSKILDWYGDDFKDTYDSDRFFPYLYGKKRAAANFIYMHLDEEKKKLLGKDKIKICYLGYNWDLNEQSATDR